MMKKGEIILLVLAIVGVLFFSACTSEQTTTQEPQPIAKQPAGNIVAKACDWRPPAGNQFPFGTCEAVVGAYFNGNSCVSLSGCPDEARGKVPFANINDCLALCQNEVGVKQNPAKVGPNPPMVKKFTITAKQFEFTPATITVNKGDNVLLTLSSVDVGHGIAIKEFNVNLKVDAGQTDSVQFVADKAGTFTFRCSVICGAGHSGMTGTLIVQ